MEDDAERVALSPTHFADAVTHFHAVVTARSHDRPFVNRKRDAMALFEPNNLDPRLHARPLLSQHELAACEFRLVTQQHDDLQRKNILAIQVLVQTGCSHQPGT